jgi:hypothetical protein
MADTKTEEITRKSFAHFPGIKGESTEPGYEGWLEITSFQVNVHLNLYCSTILNPSILRKINCILFSVWCWIGDLLWKGMEQKK